MPVQKVSQAACRYRPVLTTDAVYAAFYDDDVARGSAFRALYTGNPLACRAAVATLESSCRTTGRVERQHRPVAQRIGGLRHTALHPRRPPRPALGMIWAWDVGHATLPDFAPPPPAPRWRGDCCCGLSLATLAATRCTPMPPYVLDDEAVRCLAQGALHALHATLARSPA